MLATAWRTGMAHEELYWYASLILPQGFSDSLRTGMLRNTSVPLCVTSKFSKKFSETLRTEILVLTPIPVRLAVPGNYLVIKYISGPLHFSTLVYLTTQRGTIAVNYSFNLV